MLLFVTAKCKHRLQKKIEFGICLNIGIFKCNCLVSLKENHLYTMPFKISPIFSVSPRQFKIKSNRAAAALLKARQWLIKIVLFREKFGANGEALLQLPSTFSFYPCENLVCCARRDVRV